MSQVMTVGQEGLSDLVVDKNGELTLAKMARWLFTVEDRVSMSLPAYLKRSVVESRTFITREAAMDSDIINDVLYGINVMYAGWCMTALSLNTMVNGSKVRDVLSTVATETYDTTSYRRTDDIMMGLESFRNVKAPAVFGPGGILPDPNMDDLDGTGSGIVGGDSGRNRLVEYPKDYRLTAGITIDVSYNIGEGRNSSKVSVPLSVRLNPTIISSEVAKQFFASNFKLDFWMRKFKVKTGEIAFWNDFVFEMDLLTEKHKAIRNDKSGVLHELYENTDRSVLSYALKLIGWRADRQNIASAIHIFTKTQFDEYCRATHCNFNSTSDRLKYFRATMSMIVAIIDNEYESVDMYFAGVGNKASYSYTQMRNMAKPNQFDLTSVMKAFSNANNPRF